MVASSRTSEARLRTPWSMLREGEALLRRHPGTVLLPLALSLVLDNVVDWVDEAFEAAGVFLTEPAFWLLLVVSYLSTFALMGGQTDVALRAVRGGSASVGLLLAGARHTLDMFFFFLFASLPVLLVVGPLWAWRAWNAETSWVSLGTPPLDPFVSFTGIMVLVWTTVSSFAFGLWILATSMAPYEIVARNMDALQSIRRSLQLTVPYIGTLFWLGLLLIILQAIGLAACGVGVLYTFSAAHVAWALAYDHLCAIHDTDHAVIDT